MAEVILEAMEYLRSKEIKAVRRDNSFKICDYKAEKGKGSLAKKEKSVHWLVFSVSIA